jgi:microcystin-dependent protein
LFIENRRGARASKTLRRVDDPPVFSVALQKENFCVTVTHLRNSNNFRQDNSAEVWGSRRKNNKDKLTSHSNAHGETLRGRIGVAFFAGTWGMAVGSPYVGEIRLFAGNFAPQGWNFCDGSLVSISENPVLYQLIGTTYGGDGVNTYALPDLRSRVPLHQGTAPGGASYVIGQRGGVEAVTLTGPQIPSHTHQVQAAATGTASTPANTLILSSQSSPDPNSPPAYAAPNASTLVQLSPAAVANQGGGQPHDNMQPYLALNFIISLFGVFPSQG